MKRLIDPNSCERLLASAAAAGLLLLSGCGDPSPSRVDAADPEAAWTVPPLVEAVEWRGDVAVVAGRASPQARVVLKDRLGQAHAAAADADGRFELLVRGAPTGALLEPSLQLPRGVATGPGVLALASGPEPLAAVLTPGEASRALLGEKPLAAVETDGRSMLLSGAVEPGESVALALEGANVPVQTTRDGAWTATAPASGAARIVLNGRAFFFPGPGAAEGVERAGAGWRVTRAFSDGALQTSWFPDAQADEARGDPD